MVFKFKDLKKLAQQVNGMCAFAEDIKNRVHGDLEKIAEAKTFITGISAQLDEMEEKLGESEKTLEQLSKLLE